MVLNMVTSRLLSLPSICIDYLEVVFSVTVLLLMRLHQGACDVNKVVQSGILIKLQFT